MPTCGGVLSDANVAPDDGPPNLCGIFTPPLWRTLLTQPLPQLGVAGVLEAELARHESP